MKVLHTESSCGWGGQEIRILTEAAGMIARGHQVMIACPPESRIFGEAPRFGVDAISLPIARKSLRGLLAMRRLLAEQQADVVNTHSSTDSWLAALACASSRRPPPIVRTRHISSAIPDNAGSRWLYARVPRHVVTTGEALRLSLIEQFGLASERVTSIPTGIDPSRFQPADKTAARAELGLADSLHYLGIIATLRSWKGHRYLIDAFASLEVPDWRLLIVGTGPQQESLAAQVESLGLAGRVHLVGHQDNAQRWMQTLDVFCLPSYANEGVPQAIMQAMLTGLPIVTTPVGAILEAVADRDTALVVPPEDSGALAGALAELVRDPSLRANLGARAREYALSRFTLEIMLDRMERTFADAINQERRP